MYILILFALVSLHSKLIPTQFLDLTMINPWAPYDNYRDCSQEICSIYCPQFCYLIFPPPPPSDQDGSNTPFSPLIIAIIGVLASALVLVSYYTIVTRFCRKRRRDRGGDNSSSFEVGPDELAHDHPHGNNGLDENLIKTITVCKYQRGDGLIEGTECAVCLSEFRENESLRLLPKCSHAFHLPCIDTWLKSQSNCPLCRASVIAVTHLSPENCVSHQVHSSQDPSMAYYDDGVSSYEVQRPNDLVLVIDDREMNCRRDDVVMSVVGNNEDHSMDLETRDLENSRNDRERCRRSVSFGTLSSQRQLLISDILRIEELDEDSNMGCDGSSRGISSSKGISGLIRSPLAMRRSVSTGRFVFNVNDKGKTSAFQH